MGRRKPKTIEAECWVCLACGERTIGHMRCACVRERWAETLAANLAVGGALCESFRTGFDEGFDMAVRHGDGAERLIGRKYEHAATIGDDDAHDWRPGCGRAWGGGK